MTNTFNTQAPRHSEPREQLRAAGLRVTAPRLAILKWLATHPHSTADQVGAAIRQQLSSVSTQAIYDVLNRCSRANLLRRIEPAGHPARFETRTADNHHHLVCRNCDRTEDVDCVVGFAPCLEPSDALGFVIDEAEVTFWGLCAACQDVLDREGRIPG
ncbi:MAG: Fur family transcriptional regulator [Labedaea sp.]